MHKPALYSVVALLILAGCQNRAALLAEHEAETKLLAELRQQLAEEEALLERLVSTHKAKRALGNMTSTEIAEVDALRSDQQAAIDATRESLIRQEGLVLRLRARLNGSQ